ncbi:proton-conducting transporter membrane subunit [Pseudonocardia endophytica]|uniref:Hydrogenase-4 component F n=1 Tax=Pseudonocardia endophytica TaxID=401976 RepID=A0A4V2PJB6_PSEEN|nr:proton-conducting transporter membrane subunit [Pseudonocardia endophytica]TCK27836.1 hydrogenase-4 component F [Pseudonocardia endophytica]
MVLLVLVAPVALPALAAAGHLLVRRRRVRAWPGIVSACLVLTAAVALAVLVTSGDPPATPWALLRADAPSAFMLLVVAAVGLIACVATPAHLRGEIRAGRATARTAARHCALVQLFLSTMALAVLAANLGLLWVAIEATTVVTAFLVGQRRTRPAVEAAWKYVVICSTGIALALLGTLLLDSAAGHAGSGLAWVDLQAAAGGLEPGVTRIAVVLLVLGFGTKAGLAPLHAWLPDAHSQAPAPVSALMSGVLLSIACYALLRVRAVSDAALGPAFARGLLVLVALASLAIAASLLLAQRDYKRMLAYSSIEHMGLLALGAAVGGPVATAAVLLHVLGHGLAKSTLFLTAGHVSQYTGTSRIDDVTALAARSPVLAGCFGAGVLALVGFPPFSLFASELAIAGAGFDAGLGWAVAVAFVLVLVASAALLGHTGRMLLGPATSWRGTEPDPRRSGPVTTGPAAAGRTDPGPTSEHTVADHVIRPADVPGAARVPGTAALPGTAVAAIVGGLAACALLGVTTGPLGTLVGQAAAVLSGGAP